jgi:hypothetical protein
MLDVYLEIISLSTRAYREYLRLLKEELENNGITDLSSVQSIGLFNIGTGEKTITQLDECHSGWHVRYNAKELVKKGYLSRARSREDRRVWRVKLTSKGHDVRTKLIEMHRRHCDLLERTPITETELERTISTLRRLEKFWLRIRSVESQKPQASRNTKPASGRITSIAVCGAWPRCPLLPSGSA